MRLRSAEFREKLIGPEIAEHTVRGAKESPTFFYASYAGIVEDAVA